MSAVEGMMLGTTIAQLAIRLARLSDGAVVSMTGCADAEDVPSLKAMYVEESVLSALMSPPFKSSRIRNYGMNVTGINMYLLTSKRAFRNKSVTTSHGALNKSPHIRI